MTNEYNILRSMRLPIPPPANKHKIYKRITFVLPDSAFPELPGLESNQYFYINCVNGNKENRTLNLCRARTALSQLSYTPIMIDITTYRIFTYTVAFSEACVIYDRSV